MRLCAPALVIDSECYERVQTSLSNFDTAELVKMLVYFDTEIQMVDIKPTKEGWAKHFEQEYYHT